jgi:hypothetical protein
VGTTLVSVGAGLSKSFAPKDFVIGMCLWVCPVRLERICWGTLLGPYPIVTHDLFFVVVVVGIVRSEENTVCFLCL